jgi:hypothetical protein
MLHYLQEKEISTCAWEVARGKKKPLFPSSAILKEKSANENKLYSWSSLSRNITFSNSKKEKLRFFAQEAK